MAFSSKYKIVHEVGEPQESGVFECEDLKTQQKLTVLKVPAALKQHEIDALNALSRESHQNVAQVKEQIVEGAYRYIVSEYGKKTVKDLLDERAKSGKKLTEDEILDLLRQVLQGLYYLKCIGIAQENVTPSRIIVVNTANRRLYQILPFDANRSQQQESSRQTANDFEKNAVWQLAILGLKAYLLEDASNLRQDQQSFLKAAEKVPYKTLKAVLVDVFACHEQSLRPGLYEYLQLLDLRSKETGSKSSLLALQSQSQRSQKRSNSRRTGQIVTILAVLVLAGVLQAFLRDSTFFGARPTKTSPQKNEPTDFLERIGEKPKSRILMKHELPARSVSYSPDGAYIATGSLDKTVKVWSTKERKEVANFTGHTGPIFSVAFSPDSKFVASASRDKYVKIWDVKNANEHATLQGHTDQINSVVYSVDGQYILSASNDNTVKVWRTESLAVEKTFDLSPKQAISVAVSPNGQYFAATTSEDSTHLWRMGTWEEVKTFEGHHGRIWAATFSPDSNLMVTCGQDQFARLWDLESLRSMGNLVKHSYPVVAAAFSPDGKYVVTGSQDKWSKIVDVKKKKEVMTIKDHHGTPYGIAFSPDGKYLVMANEDKNVTMFGMI